jgi:FlaG/FlaF family flagellin (archaellin)
MNQKDLGTIAVVVVVSAILSVVVTGKVFTSSASQRQVEIVQPISTNFPTVDKAYFNNQTYDPTQVIQIQQNNNTQPFGSDN